MKTPRNITYIPESGDLDKPYCTGRELMDATRTVVKVLGRKSNSTVRFDGNNAYTNGTDVVLPSLPDDATLTKREGLVTAGYANHETLHNLLTDLTPGGYGFNKRQEWAKDKKHLTKAIQNCLEDVRIERGGKELYAGIPKAIDKTADAVTTNFINEVYPQDKDIVNHIDQVCPVAITWEGRRRMGYPSESNQKAMDLLPQHVKDWVNQCCDIVFGIPHGVTGMGEVDKQQAYDGSNQVCDIAERIANELKQGKNPDGTPIPQTPIGNGKRKQKGNGNATGNDGTRVGQSNGNPQASDDESNTGGNSQGNERRAEEDSTGDDNSNSHTHGAITGNAEESEVEPINGNLAQAIEDIFQGKCGSGDYRVQCRDDDHWRHRRNSKVKFDIRADSDPRLNDDRHGTTYARLKKDMGNMLGTMRRKLELALVSQNRNEIHRRKRHGKLDTRKLTNVISFDTEVFRRRVMSNAIDTAVSIVVDMSGSMNGGRIKLARDCTIALANALENTKVSYEIVGHHTQYKMGHSSHTNSTEQEVNKVTNGKFNRKDATRMYMFKAFSEKLSDCRKSLGAMASCTGGANADGDSWLYAFDRLVKQPEKRKVMLCLCDGYPAYESDYGDMDTYQRTADVVKYMGTYADVIGIGIQSSSVKNFFPKYVVINQLNDLPKVVMDELGKALLGKNFKVDNSDLIKGNKING